MATADLVIERTRESERDAKRSKRAAESEIEIPPCEDRVRREGLEADDVAWLMHYFGDGCGVADPFTYDFVPEQRDIVQSLGYALRNGQDQAIAASRGGGKTTIAERLVLKYTLQGACDYAVIFASTGPMAENILDSIDNYIQDNDRLAADYPEVCVPVRALEGAPQRANTQRVRGVRQDTGEPYLMVQTRFSWCGNELVFPRVPGSPSAGSIIATRGLDAAVRGLKKKGKRPKLAIVDDPDTEDTARSEDQATKLEKRIDAAIGGLGGQRRSIGRVVLTTLQSRTAISFKLTDPKQKPTFRGRRYRWLVAPPERADLWDEYVQLRLADMQQRDEHGSDLDPEARRAHGFYLANQVAMDAGAVVGNPNRFDPSVLPDGTQREVSALQAYYNLIAKYGPEVVATEYDNDPPEDTALVESGLTATRVQRQLSGIGRGIVPPGCKLLTQGIDCRKTALHWVVRAWRPDGTGFTIAYGVHEVRGTIYGKEDGVDVALHRAILERIEATRQTQWANDQGEGFAVDLTLIDAGYKTDAVYSACSVAGAGVMPVMGFGRSAGCVSVSFSDQYRATQDKRPGDGWFLSRKGRVWLVCADADRWKSWEHDRWLTDPARPGSMLLWGSRATQHDRLSDDEKAHHSYARHVVSETEVEEPYRGTIRRRWKCKSENNHWLDASYYSDVAMSIRGLRVETAGPSVLPRKVDPAARPSIKEMMGARR